MQDVVREMLLEMISTGCHVLFTLAGGSGLHQTAHPYRPLHTTAGQGQTQNMTELE